MEIVAENYLNLHGTFFMFGGVLAVLLPISYVILPETKDISLGPVVRNPLTTKYLRLYSNLIWGLGRKSLVYVSDLTAYFRTYRANLQKQRGRGRRDLGPGEHFRAKYNLYLTFTLNMQRTSAWSATNCFQNLSDSFTWEESAQSIYWKTLKCPFINARESERYNSL